MKLVKVVLMTVITLALICLSVFGAPRPEPPAGEAVVWYLGHCGYAIRTQNHFLIFDYQEERDDEQPKARPEKPSLNLGWIDPAEIKDLKVRVFVSHSHADHYSPVIAEWKKVIPDIAYFYGWKVPDEPGVHSFPGPRTEFRSDDLEIATINSRHSGVPESAWLVKVDGLVIYHNGDCRPDNSTAANDYLKTKTDHIDLAFVAPLIASGEQYGRQNRDLFKKFRTGAVFPMHVTAMYLDFQKAVRAEFPGVDVRVPMRMGQQFTFAKGKIVD